MPISWIEVKGPVRRCLTPRGWGNLEMLKSAESLVFKYKSRIRNRTGDRVCNLQPPGYDVTLEAARHLFLHGNLEMNILSLWLLAEMLQARRSSLLKPRRRWCPILRIWSLVLMRSKSTGTRKSFLMIWSLILYPRSGRREKWELNEASLLQIESCLFTWLGSILSQYPLFYVYLSFQN